MPLLRHRTQSVHERRSHGDRGNDAKTRMTAFRVAVAKGDAQLDRNEGVAYTPELMESMTQTALQDMHTGKPVDADILP